MADISVLPSARITSGDFVLLKLKGDQYAIQQVKPDTTISCGRKGDKLSFAANELIDQPYGLTYEVDGRRLRRLLRDEVMALQTDNFANLELKAMLEGVNNQTLLDDNSSQTLTEEDVRALKATEGLKSEELVQKIAASSATFDTKTVYAQAKWIKRKLEKHGRYVTAVRPDAFQLWPYFFRRASARPRLSLRGDTLSQMLAHLNVHAGTRGIVVDDAFGIPTLALLERMGGSGRLIHIHELFEPSIDALDVLPSDHPLRDPLRILPALRVETPMTHPPEIADGDAKKMERRQKILDQMATQKELHAGHFDFLCITTSNASPQSIVQTLEKYIAPSRPIVIVRDGQPELLQAAEMLRYDEKYLDSKILEPWSRTYQVLPDRLHPEMTSSAHGGYILKTIKASSRTCLNEDVEK